MNFFKKAGLLVVSSVALLFTTSTGASAFSLGVEVEGEEYNVSFPNKTFDQSLITFTSYESAIAAAEAIVAVLNSDFQDFAKSDGFRKGSDTIYIPYETKVNKKGNTLVSTVRIRESNDGTDEFFYGTRTLKSDRASTYANFENVPEPLTVLGSIAAVGMGTLIKRQRQRG
ncbi:MAG: PEP-CTERM sorting domain-containing protein [Cyanobacteria bacterium P01_F01_bin.86]